MFRKSILAIVTLCLAAVAVIPVWAANKSDKTQVSTAGDPLSLHPYLDQRVHKVGNVGMTITNYGIYGTQMDPSIRDPETGLPAPSCQFPYGSGIEYLFQGALWIGAVVDNDTLVSAGQDGWQLVFEMYPNSLPEGLIVKRSTRPDDPAYSPDAVSEADYIATYYDTLTDPSWVASNPDDGRPHIPLGLKIVQESYSWSASIYEDFILFRYRIKNIGSKYLHQVFCGVYFDCDIYHPTTGNGFQDDISGSYRCFDETMSESVFVAWSADNNGDPSTAGQWDFRSPSAAIGASLMDYPTSPQLSFNWWVSWGDPATLDWGPRRQENNRNFGTGGLGTPAGDRNKYYIMSTPENDYDQLWSAVDQSAQGWLPPNATLAGNLADGYDTRFLLSFGAIDLAPGDSTEFAFVVAMGDNFHRNPTDFQRLFDRNNPQAFYDSLDFSDLTTNVLAARQLYRQLFVVIPGDADRSGIVDVIDAIYLINYIFIGGPAPSPLNVADVNADCCINIADVVYLIRYIFSGGPAPVAGCID
ncbi:MAG: hypothetical protein E4G91_03605 [Candidatus Zixiibacteriota bacterium]|nr:MAG: hypothetical protein E4G91_03605 [candidate division Zixibacteria bacterium]